MKIIVTGANGQLGSEVVLEATRHCHEVITTTNNSIDITRKSEITKFICENKPDAVIHCAAWTAVDIAEDTENINEVINVNSKATKYIANACKKIDAKMIYISTDYVFGDKTFDPLEADCKLFNPLNIYGSSKLEGELAVSSILDKFFIVRTSWIFGKNGKNFTKTMINIAKNNDTVSVVSDQIGRPTYAVDLAKLLVDMAESEAYGFYHATNEGSFISWYDFAREIFKQINSNIDIKPIKTSEYSQVKANRPTNSRLDTTKLKQCGFQPLPNWKDALLRFIKELEING